MKRPGLSSLGARLRNEPRNAGGASASGLEHIVVLAGASGSGKSTFFREFIADRLPKEISDSLPEHAKTWKCTSANELSRKGLSRILGGNGLCPGLVVHYDIMRAYTRGFENHAHDPAMQAVMGAGTALTIMTLMPSREALFDQLLKRARSDEYEEPWETRRWTRRLQRKLRRALYTVTGKSPMVLKEGHVVLLEVYGSERRLEQWTTRWDNFLGDMRRDRDNVRLVYVGPDSAEEGNPRFRLLRRLG